MRRADALRHCVTESFAASFAAAWRRTSGPAEPAPGSRRRFRRARRTCALLRGGMRWRKRCPECAHDRIKRDAVGHVHDRGHTHGHDNRGSATPRHRAHSAHTHRELTPRFAFESARIVACYLDTEMRYTTCAPSSENSSEPSGATVTPTGRPFTLPFFGSGTSPVRNGCGSPEGWPSLKGTKTIW